MFNLDIGVQRTLRYCFFVTARKRSLRRLWGYVFTGVCLSTGGVGGVPGQVHPLGRYPVGQVHPPVGTLTWQVHPWQVHPIPWQVHPPGRYTPGQVHHPPRQVHHPQQVHPPGRHTPPPGQVPPLSSACWEIRATSEAVRILVECILVLPAVVQPGWPSHWGSQQPLHLVTCFNTTRRSGKKKKQLGILYEGPAPSPCWMLTWWFCF